VGKYDEIRTDVSGALEDAERTGGYVTTMLDLYGLPNDFPGRVAAPRGDPRAKVAFIEDALWRDVGSDPRLIPYIQLHEFEALVLANLPSLIGRIALRAGVNRGALPPDVLQRFSELQAAIDEAGGPEAVDDGDDTAPSRRIDRAGGEFYSCRKLTDGVKAAGELALPLMRERCPHFGAWVTRLEKLGAASGV
jgi:hypothetical protein